jgi:hypothetical protein
MMRFQLMSAVRAVETTGIAGNDLVGKCLLTDFTGVLTFSIVEIEVSVVSTAPWAVSFKVKVLTVSDGLYPICSDEVFRTKLLRLSDLNDRLLIYNEVGIGSHWIL